MRVDWSATTENMPACDTAGLCRDALTSRPEACWDATDDAEPTLDDKGLLWTTFCDENGNSVLTEDETNWGYALSFTKIMTPHTATASAIAVIFSTGWMDEWKYASMMYGNHSND